MSDELGPEPARSKGKVRRAVLGHPVIQSGPPSVDLEHNSPTFSREHIDSSTLSRREVANPTMSRNEADTPTFAIDVRLPLDRFELDVAFESAGPIVGIFGPSGAGKSSLLAAVAGLRRGAIGSIRVGERVLLDSAAGILLPPESRGIGYVPQDGLLFPHLSVRGNLLSGSGRAKQVGVDPDVRLASIVEVLEIGGLLDRDVGSLSGGERQRVALGRALCSGPHLLLLDEPLAALDLPLRRRLLPVLRRLRSAFPIPTLLVSHDPVEVQALCDQIVVLDVGRIVAIGDPRDVLSDPAVYPLAEVDVVRTVLPGRIVSHGESTSLIRLGSTGLERTHSSTALSEAHGDTPMVEGADVSLVTMPAAGAIGDEVLVSIAAREVILATSPVSGISARNVLPATISSIRGNADRVLVAAVCGESIPPIAVEITRATVADMELIAGGRVYVIIKAASCRLIE